MSATALVELRFGLEALAKADMTLDGLLQGRKVFALEAPSSARLAYAIIGPVLIDRSDNYYSQPGRRHRRRLSFWAENMGTAELIYARMCALLDGQLFVIEGHTMQTASLDFLAGPMQDVDRKAWGIHADWTVKTLEAA